MVLLVVGITLDRALPGLHLGCLHTSGTSEIIVLVVWKYQSIILPVTLGVTCLYLDTLSHTVLWYPGKLPVTVQLKSGTILYDP